MTTILGVDPGKMTGFSLYQHDQWIGAWELPMDEFLAWAEAYLLERCTLMEHIVVACENFHITVQTAKKSQGDRSWSLEQIGVLRRDSRKYGHEFELTSPSDAKNFSGDDKLKNAGWFLKGTGHGNDATRQIVIALGRRGVVIGMS